MGMIEYNYVVGPIWGMVFIQTHFQNNIIILSEDMEYTVGNDTLMIDIFEDFDNKSLSPALARWCFHPVCFFVFVFVTMFVRTI